MASKKVKVTYQDGREVVVRVPPRAQVMTEQYVGGFKSERAILATYYLGWAALNKSGQESLDFETWLDQIDDVEDVDDDEQPDPTPPAPSAGDSSE